MSPRREYPKLDRAVSFCVTGDAEARNEWASLRSETVAPADDGGAAAHRRIRHDATWWVRYFEVSGRLPRTGNVTAFIDDHGDLWQIRAIRQIDRRRFLEFEATRFEGATP